MGDYLLFICKYQFSFSDLSIEKEKASVIVILNKSSLFFTFDCYAANSVGIPQPYPKSAESI